MPEKMKRKKKKGGMLNYDSNAPSSMPQNSFIKRFKNPYGNSPGDYPDSLEQQDRQIKQDSGNQKGGGLDKDGLG